MKQKNEEENEKEEINIMLLGNSAVGKTSFIIKYTEETFQDVYLSTIGIDFKVKNITINNKQYILSFYDTTGQERFRALSFNMVKNANGIILMYDITNLSSFESIPEWIRNVREIKGKNFPIILLGNKIDDEKKRKITKEKGEDLAEENNIKFFEISNKEGINIEEAALTLVNEIIKSNNFIKRKGSESSFLSNKSSSSFKSKKCC